MKKENGFKKQKKILDNRENIDLKSQFKTVKTGVKNGVFIFSKPLTVEELSQKLNKSSSDILKFFFMKGVMKNINTLLDENEIGELCLEFNFDFEKRIEIDETNILSNLNVVDDEKDLKPRPPIVTIMGHVDHGKTTLLDYIRNTCVAKGEAGGITQSIGAYQVKKDNNIITFIDTPGHAAFTEMRARGAHATDIVILVVAADDGIKPQTIEAIDHAKAAKVPIIVFINKCDKPNINIDNVLSQLSEHELTSEKWGGDTITVEGSALTGMGVNKLLEAIITLSQVMELKANPNRLGMGVIIEANLDKGLGPVASVIIQNGTVAKGDMLIAGASYGRIRAMLNDHNEEINLAYPAQPVKITGLNAVPQSGDHFVISNNEKDIKEIAEHIRLYQINEQNRERELLSVDADTNSKRLIIILKADVHGSLEAIKNMLGKMNVDGVSVVFLRGATGGITKSDVELAKASKGIIIGFNVKPNKAVKDLANMQQVPIYFFDIIYRLSETVEKIMKKSLDPIYVEEETAEAEVKQIWTYSKVGTIIGCGINSGEINRNDQARVLRDGVVIAKTKIASLRHGKEDITKISSGKECGITLENFNDVKVGDIIQTFKIVEKQII
ncbi:translation initiation factor IF-2 [Candidatus Malacoplasma girerdii]|uniref:Translation initiation factor IF-2 n=1 Tax=Candidatus Malacoplasma girerdii TaxID=1318617 RepID=A0A097STI6_9BACT|nr:translation initiation factor IF-2 [Candidatus Malacoplasma girerdii]ASJ89414.1 MAG: translation initiation factor IF-2 [Candidatus Malacoplasma girerdii]